jgi:UDP-N-acetyl-D-glucosamine dehydrogenase
VQELIDKIKHNTAKIAILGLGYVGLPLAMAFAERFRVIGYDINKEKINLLLKGKSSVVDVTDEELKERIKISFFPTNDLNRLRDCDFIIICVPTPLTHENEPDLMYIKSAGEITRKILRVGQFVILESTTYPTTTEDFLIPILEKSGLRAGIDFGVAYSPERIDPGNKTYSVKDIPKVVGGINDESTQIASELYKSIIGKTIKVSNPKTAEAVKMVENVFRNINIALVNELALLFEKMEINVWEVIDAAATKPYGFMPFYPGPGIGGHCIPLDPLYMSYVAKRYDFIPRFIETSREINEFMKIHVINLVRMALQKVNKSVSEATIAVLGLAYKRNIDDARESPSIKIIEELQIQGAEVKVFDPYINSIMTGQGILYSEKTAEDVLKNADCAVFVVDHDFFKELNDDVLNTMRNKAIVDCKNIFDRTLEGVINVGIGKYGD